MSFNRLTTKILQAKIDKLTVHAGPSATVLTANIAAGDSGATPVTTSKVENGSVSKTLDSLTQYMPTEVVTLYVAAVASDPALAALFGSPKCFPTLLYVVFLFVVTPIVSIGIYILRAAEVARASLPDPAQKVQLPGLRELPWWKILESMIAFAVWGLAIPNPSPIIAPAARPAIGFLALFISGILSTADKIVELVRGQAVKKS